METAAMAEVYLPEKLTDADCAEELRELLQKRVLRYGERSRLPSHRREVAALERAIALLAKSA